MLVERVQSTCACASAKELITPGARVYSTCVRAYRPKIPGAGSTTFLARLLTLGDTLAEQKCVSRRGGFSQRGAARARSPGGEIVSEIRKKSVFPIIRWSATKRNRHSTIALLWQCVVRLARAVVLEREMRPNPRCHVTIFAKGRLRRQHDHRMHGRRKHVLAARQHADVFA